MTPPTVPSEFGPPPGSQPLAEGTGSSPQGGTAPRGGISPEGSPPTPTPGTPSDPATAEAETAMHCPRHRVAAGRIGPYELLEEIARGGMGVVYKARHMDVGRVVALKMIRADALSDGEHAQRFEREVRATVRLSHPNIVPVYEVGQHEGQRYYTMALLPGNLAEQRAQLPDEPRTVVTLMGKIARAVQYAHEQGVVHRDLKPSNILIDERGEPQVGDFGLAKFAEEDLELTRTGAVLGTPAYMAPEQAAGRIREIGPATDVWALGVMLFELLTGRKPFVGESAEEVKERIVRFQPPAPRTVRPALPPALEAIVLRCLEKNPRDRYPSAGALAADLDRFLRGEHVPTHWRGWSRWIRNTVRRHPLWTAAALCLTAVLTWAAIALFSGGNHGGQPDSPRPLVLLADSAPPGPLHWVLGGKDAMVVADRPFCVRTNGRSVLELQNRPPWDRFRLEAKVRHEDSKPDDGEVGIFAAHHEYGAPQDRYRALAKFGFADKGKGSFRGKTAFCIWHIPLLSPDAISCSAVAAPHFFDPTRLTGEDRPWRRIALEITPEEIQAFGEGEPVVKISVDAMVNKTAAAFPNLPFRNWQFDSSGGVGIYVNGGTASFEDVTIRPITRE